MRVTKLFVLRLIGWDVGASFLDQSQSELKQTQQNQDHLWCFIENYSNMFMIYGSQKFKQVRCCSFHVLNLNNNWGRPS